MNQSQVQPLRVFLCHAREDKADVRQLHKRLRSEGIEPWFDEESLLPGQDWHREIQGAIQTTDVVLVCLSQRSVSKVGYMQREMRFALDKAEEQPEGTIFIIPVRLEDCTVPDRLRTWQWVDLFEEEGYDRLIRALIHRAKDLGRMVKNLTPIEYYSVFISYSNTDAALARRLYADLQAAGVRCWFAPHDLVPGDIIAHGIDEAIRLYDKVVLLLSKSAVNSYWVVHEVDTARAREARDGRIVLYPLRLDDTVLTTEHAWAAMLREARHIGDFRRWKDYDAYQQAFARLLRDLRAG